MSQTTQALSKPILAEPGSSYMNNHPQESQEWVEVLVDVPFKTSTDDAEDEEKLFTYKIPPDLDIQPGDILTVPFGSQQVGAIAIRKTSQLPEGLTSDRIKNVSDIITRGFFPPTYWQLIEKVASYYQTPIIRVIRTALPPGLLKRSQRRIRIIEEAIPTGAEIFLNATAKKILEVLQNSKTKDYTWQYIQRQVKSANRGLKDLLQRGWVESYLEPPSPPKPKLRQAVTLVVQNLPRDLTPRQQEVMEVLRRNGGETWLTELLNSCKTNSSVVRKLEEKGYVIIEAQEVLRREEGRGNIRDEIKILTPYQAEALTTITQIQEFAQVLLHGVTGSGKTEVYLQAIAPILENGKSALVLVPEIGLTPQLTDRFRARFGNKVYVYHSALSPGERYDTWRNMTWGIPQVIIGTRSAIFAPLPKLGLIVLDEEHDNSFKQDRPTPCYHARTVAKWRAELENCPLILGSATPSLESWLETREYHPENLSQGDLNLGENVDENVSPKPNTQNLTPKTYYLSLPERVHSRPMPPIEIVDMRQQLRQGNRTMFSYPLQEALQQLQETKQQGILFIHRRGHSTFVSCRSCGYVMECPHCDVSLSYHYTHEGGTQLLRCHYCNYTQLQPQRCPECDSPFFKFFGSGTQKVTQELTRQFPDLRCIRYDSDTTRTKDAHRILLTQFANGEADLLIGTQMLTKGLDLAQVTLVGVVSADGLLHFSDYRANERAFQTLLQVAGRAGRGDNPGQVIIQTYTPEHPVIQAVQRNDYESFVETELQTRAELLYPPYGRLILLRLSSYDPTEVAVTAQKLASVLMEKAEAGKYDLLGPAPAPIARVANRYRWQILLKLLSGCEDVPDLTKLINFCPPAVSLTVDVDPMSL
ncbi:MULTISPECIES: primosomal protein N' [Okeania]|uniref:Replication restart protein PriA n=1 Tax=Okeania hirsuta TaxID=1458930 RepID=A0A3N6NTS3_9CYAN|nr:MULTISPECIES: primosomal protein N' [Okeania]NES77715.1 primosomal protein N' [Okeania sp. SIO1H4]NES88918.1 primosomal protein N' [Okeania sp. SIO2B9]NET21359.1 primosomal protein N' [Okeania sp. SIO1H5]NET78037.1 primosomal protein N' [Okeania sp. SIO1F9]NET94534.1 primosomal protein N' [Okeania sp. SIO1H2]